MSKQVRNVVNAWRRFQAIDRQIARNASRLADTSLDDRRAVEATPRHVA